MLNIVSNAVYRLYGREIAQQMTASRVATPGPLKKRKLYPTTARPCVNVSMNDQSFLLGARSTQPINGDGVDQSARHESDILSSDVRAAVAKYSFCYSEMRRPLFLFVFGLQLTEKLC